MKRGWITWDRTELPVSVFEARVQAIRKVLAERDLPALAVYTDIWRSNQARYFSNVMPYWNRAILVVSREKPPILICGLSPRVYPWIRSITILDDIRPNNNLAKGLLQLCTEFHWKRIGAMDLPQMPQDINASICSGEVDVADVPSQSVYDLGADESEISMRRRAAEMARRIVGEELPKGVGTLDYQFVGRLERAFRRAGAEDLVILLSDGKTAPLPAKGRTLEEGFSLALALEYRGHWVKLSRPQVSAESTNSIRNLFHGALDNLKAPSDGSIYTEKLSGSYPYESCERSAIARGWIFALHVESDFGGRRTFYGDTCWYGQNGVELL